MKHHIALIEDDDVIRSNYSDVLRSAGFEISAYPTKESALIGLQQNPPELVLLDITLNGERDAGFDICAILRRRDARVPIIFLTSHDGEVDKISGLRIGADDYVTKDASFDYLIVRIEALFRRRHAMLESGQISEPKAQRGCNGESPISIDETTSSVVWKGHRVDLTLTQFWMLRELCSASGSARTHTELMRAAKIVVEPNTVTAHVKAIRDAFRQVDQTFDHLRTERGRGYRWTS